MSRLQCRGPVVLAAAVVALFSSRPAAAQVGGLFHGTGPGYKYDAADQAAAEHHLQHRRAKLALDSERGNPVAVDHDVRRIDRLRYRIAVDEWLIRKQLLQDPCYYPVRTDPVSCAAIADAARPPWAAPHP